MKKITDPDKLQFLLERLRARGKRIGFVPTMGALHEGHLALVRQARRENDVVVVSIFINRLQFGPKEDFRKYPRPIRQDLKLLQREKADLVFVPSHESMYPSGYSLYVDYSEKMNALTRKLCGQFRPGHFRGVLTVVAKLFNMVRPHTAYFGQKDYQQAQVICRLNRDLNFGIRISVEPTVREKDGLAMSSRNAYLNVSDRARALALSQTLFEVRDAFKRGERNLQRWCSYARKKLAKLTDKVQYFEIVDPDTLESLRHPKKTMVALTACYVGKTRLIDNVIIKI